MSNPSPQELAGLLDRVLPCPFCGGTDQMVIDRTCDQTTPYNPADFAYPRVICRCGVEMAGENWSDKRTAIAKWNRRSSLKASSIAMEGE